MTATINYGETRIDGLKIIDVEPKKGRVLRMSVNDQVVEPTDRFWTSLCANYSNQGLSTKLFNMFSHAEVFERLSHNQKKSRIRFALEEANGLPRLLGVSNPAKPYVHYKDQLDILSTYEAENVVYNGGMVQSTHTPTRMPSFKIGPDEFEYKFVMETPIDGYGLPSVYLSLLRYVCTNGAIGYARAFKSQIKLGSKEDNITHVIRRTLEGYSNEEGFQALRDRWESASKSYVSLGECNKIWNTLHKMSQSAMFLDEKDLDPSKARIVESCRKRYEAVHPGSENSELMSSL